MRNKIEQASWLSEKEPWKITSFMNFTRVHVWTLLDWAYLWKTGENVLIRTPNNWSWIDFEVRGSRSGKRIAAINPGIKKVSKFLPSQITGDVLATMENRNFYALTHYQAVKEWLLVEKEYDEIFFYNGDLDLASFYEKIQNRIALPDDSSRESQWLIKALKHTLDHILEIPKTTYQVSREWSGRIFLINNDKVS